MFVSVFFLFGVPWISSFWISIFSLGFWKISPIITFNKPSAVFSLLLFFWDTIIYILVCLKVSQNSFMLSCFSFIGFSFCCFYYVMSTALDSRLMIFSSA